MKVRILGNSIRFRLKQNEVHKFQEEGKISEVTEFGPEEADKLTFTLLASGGNHFIVNKSFDAITIEIPQKIATEWTHTSLVGFEESIDTGKGKIIKVLVEKDFKCLDGSDKENQDSYPNPNVHC